MPQLLKLPIIHLGNLVFATIFIFFFLQWRVGGPSENMLPLKGQQCKLISWRKKELQHKPNPIP